jgi:hypothetical protein
VMFVDINLQVDMHEIITSRSLVFAISVEGEGKVVSVL